MIDKPLVHVASVALLTPRHEVLVAQRPSHKSMAGLWEFPGGKLEPNETPEICLVRELQEEINIIIPPHHLEPLSFTSYDYGSFHLIMYLFICTQWQQTPVGKEGQELTWVALEKLKTISMPPANAPLLTRLQQFSQSQQVNLA